MFTSCYIIIIQKSEFNSRSRHCSILFCIKHHECDLSQSPFSFPSLITTHTKSQKFGTTIVARNLKIRGGYKPGASISRNLIAYSNLYWAKKLAGAVKGGGGGLLGGNHPVGVLTAEQVNFDEVENFGDISRCGIIFQEKARKG